MIVNRLLVIDYDHFIVENDQRASEMRYQMTKKEYEMINKMQSKYRNLAEKSSQKATWISFSIKRQLEIIEKMISLNYKYDQIRSLYIAISKSKLADQITLVGIMIMKEIEFDSKMIENDLRDFIISKWDDLKATFESYKIDRSMIKADQTNSRFSIKQLLVFASQDADLMQFVIDLAE